MKITNEYLRLIISIFRVIKIEINKFICSRIISREFKKKYIYKFIISPCVDDSQTLTLTVFCVDDNKEKEAIHDFAYDYLDGLMKDRVLLLCDVKSSEITKKYYSEFL